MRMRHVAAGVLAGLLVAPIEGAQAAGDGLEALAGVWKAPRREVSLSSDLHVAVWGKGALQVRDVELVIEPSGDAVLKVATSVVGPEGKTKAYSASVTEAKLRIKTPNVSEEAAGGAIRPEVIVVSAEERYLDDPNDRHAVDGLQISLGAQAPDSPSLNFRFDTARGRGSFGETLIRQNVRRSP